MIFSERLNEIINGNRKSLIKLLTDVESFREPEIDALVEAFKGLQKRPQIIGVIGNPGAGKSTFINNYLSFAEIENKKVGMILMDPSSPLDGGAILGDRIRMSSFYKNKNFLIRSISNLGSEDGLNPLIEIYSLIMSLYNFEVILVEAVGGGQANTGIGEFVDKTILIFDPFAGDGVQHIKSGVLEIADDIIISKKDIANSSIVAHSLEDFKRDGQKIISVDLLDENSLHEYYHKELGKNSDLDDQSLLKSLFKKNIKNNYYDLIDQFFNNSSLISSLPDLNVRSLEEKFTEFLKKIVK